MTENGAEPILHQASARPKALIEAAERVIVVADHSKFGKRALVRACDLDAIDMLITDAPPPADLSEKLDAAGVVVEVAA